MATLLTVEDAAAELGTPVRFVRRLIHERRIRFHKIGKYVRIARIDLQRSSMRRVSMRQARCRRGANTETAGKLVAGCSPEAEIDWFTGAKHEARQRRTQPCPPSIRVGPRA